MIKYIIFDKDGTLMDFDKYWFEITKPALKAVLLKYNIPQTLAQDIYKAFGFKNGTLGIDGVFYTGNYKEIVSAMHSVLAEKGYNTDFDALYSDMRKEFDSNVSAGEIVSSCSDIKGLFKVITDIGIKAALVTADSVNGAKECLEKLEIINFFDKIIGDDGVYPSKPDPYHINKIMSEYSLSAEEIVMVGDTITDMQFAKNAGIKAVGVAKSENNKNILKTVADIVLTDISEITKVILN